jgi:hypothetical protein
VFKEVVLSNVIVLMRDSQNTLLPKSGERAKDTNITWLKCMHSVQRKTDNKDLVLLGLVTKFVGKM